MKWFKHFTTAHSNNDLTKVRMRYGAEGYAIYWYCLEVIAGELGENNNFTFELKHDAEVIGYELKIDQVKVEQIMRYMIELDLFSNVDGAITCFKLGKYLDKKGTRSQQIHEIIDSVRDCPRQSATNPPRVDKSRVDKSRVDKHKHIPQRQAVKSVPYAAIVDLYHEILPTLPQCKALNSSRKQNIKARFNESLTDLNNWRNYFEYVSQSDFLMGKVEPSQGKRRFYATLTWLTNSNNYLKVLEEQYHG